MRFLDAHSKTVGYAGGDRDVTHVAGCRGDRLPPSTREPFVTLAGLRGMGSRLATVLLVVAVNAPAALHAAQGLAACEGVAATIVGTEGDDVIAGTEGRDVIVTLDGDDSVDAAGGDDLVCAGDERDTIEGGDGHDELHGDFNSDFLAGGAGNDRLFGGGSPDELDGGEGDDHLRGGWGWYDELYGGGGADDLRGDEADDPMRGGSGDDVMEGYRVGFTHSLGPVEVDLAAGTATGDGTDRLVGIVEVTGSPFGDVLRGTTRWNYLYGGAGGDRIEGRGGEDMLGGGGDGDVVLGGDGRDLVFGEIPDREVVGNDEYAGGSGHDYFMAVSTGLPVYVDLGAGRVFSEGLDTISGIESVRGSYSARNKLLGDARDNALHGGSGRDEIRGRGGDDHIASGMFGGRDSLWGGVGDDGLYVDVCSEGVAYDGGPGTDWINPGSACGNWARVDLMADTIVTESGSGSVIGIENVFGLFGRDVLIGDDGPNVLRGDAGGDELLGGGGDDKLYGGDGEDSADGGGGSDFCDRVEQRTSCERG